MKSTQLPWQRVNIYIRFFRWISSAFQVSVIMWYLAAFSNSCGVIFGTLCSYSNSKEMYKLAALFFWCRNDVCIKIQHCWPLLLNLFWVYFHPNWQKICNGPGGKEGWLQTNGYRCNIYNSCRQFFCKATKSHRQLPKLIDHFRRSDWGSIPWRRWHIHYF